MTQAASAVHNANPDILIFFSGLESDFNIEPAVGGSTLLDPTFRFRVADYEWASKFVFEIHEYDEGISSNCDAYKTALLAFGWDATTKWSWGPFGGNKAPLVISEWGHEQSDASGAYNSAYATCLRGFMEERKVGYMMWVLAGSYYIREGNQDTDESYGESFCSSDV
jgi:Cellulase (glycosyl hydrolase family 5)